MQYMIWKWQEDFILFLLAPSSVTFTAKCSCSLLLVIERKRDIPSNSELLSTVFIACVYNCVCVSACVCTRACECVEVRGQRWVLSFTFPLALLLAAVYARLASIPGFSCVRLASCHRSTGITDVCPCPAGPHTPTAVSLPTEPSSRH